MIQWCRKLIAYFSNVQACTLWCTLLVSQSGVTDGAMGMAVMAMAIQLLKALWPPMPLAIALSCAKPHCFSLIIIYTAEQPLLKCGGKYKWNMCHQVASLAFRSYKIQFWRGLHTWSCWRSVRESPSSIVVWGGGCPLPIPSLLAPSASTFTAFSTERVQCSWAYIHSTFQSIPPPMPVVDDMKQCCDPSICLCAMSLAQQRCI